MDKELKEFRILNFKRNSSLLNKLLLNKNIEIVDTYKEQLNELWQIRNPGKSNTLQGVRINEQYCNQPSLKECGTWVWYPWRRSLIHILDNIYFQELRTARNKLLINEKEQKLFQNFDVGIAGLSVGNNIAMTIRIQGGSKTIKLADNDNLEVSNMNRIRAGLFDLGKEKVEIAKEQILEIDPYSKVILFKKGINRQNLQRFCDRTDLLFDEVDDLKVKILLRMEAKRRKIPMIMLTDNEDGVLVDYYPYQKITSTPLFYGLKDDHIKAKLSYEKINKKEIAKLSSQIVGLDNISPRMKLSLENVGKKLYSWPQLATAAFSAGVVGCYFARMISIGNNFSFKRGLIRVNDLIPCN